jgi:hypothetical protein
MGFIYVTAFIELEGCVYFDASTFIDHFFAVAECGVPIILYASKSYYDMMKERLEYYKNVSLGAIVELEDLWAYKTIKSKEPVALPAWRSETKDNLNYMALQHSKIELIQRAMKYTAGSHYAWLDFRIGYVFKDVEGSKAHLKTLSESKLAADFLAFPGCWELGRGLILETVCWRFCGGFFAGSRGALDDFWRRTQTYLPLFLDETHTITWEVNFWAWMERYKNWRPTWYAADHNDSIIRLPGACFHYNRLVAPENIEPLAGLPVIENMNPMSAAHISYRGIDLLNIRYINYRITDAGTFDIAHPNCWLVSKNMCCILEDGMRLFGFIGPMTTENLGLQKYGEVIQGLEDIRLFEWKGAINFIATQREYSPCGRNRMVWGIYDTVDGSCKQGRLLQPPGDTWCEKNWIPIPCDASQMHFIYNWGPWTVGTIDDSGRLIPQITKEMPPLFSKLKGSTVPVRYGNELICVAHYSEGEIPRNYFHLLVGIDPATLCPIWHTDPFVFCNIGIEYCIGFTIKKAEAHFWISRRDRDPGLVRVPMDRFLAEKKLI